MARLTPTQAGGQNVLALLDTLAHAEIGADMLAATDDGYNVLVGSLPDDLDLFDSYADHPLIDGPAIEYAPGLWSTAAGRYQILSRYWRHYQRQLGLPDFGPESQDRYAIQQMREQGALPMIQAGRFSVAVERCRNIWASLPGAGYGQHEHSLETLVRVYVAAGGQLEGEDRDWYDRVAKALPGEGAT
ncbi:glycoside hydrolase family 24 protein [Halomonas elongata]|uniref:glycoside hydrolase family 24 protein n=1 Tax=Halomonas elongata TaxID=2746 RepID=UPI00186BB297|nr:glycoside hydrolase family 104 protein [Halomonas elongata]MBW5801174.1 glycoside hydrolase family 104 protein [Halomonas elongata]